jgi:hypothetical protein
MKRSFIITVAICLILGESFTFINKKDQQKSKATIYCCKKICSGANADNKTKKTTEETYLPMVNMLWHNL